MERLWQKDPAMARRVECRLPDLSFGVLTDSGEPVDGLYLDGGTVEKKTAFSIILLRWEAIRDYSTWKLGALLLHELVHSCGGGRELDALAYAAFVFPEHVDPPSEEWMAVFHREPEGKYVRLDRATGVMRSKVSGEVLTRFQSAAA